MKLLELGVVVVTAFLVAIQVWTIGVSGEDWKREFLVNSDDDFGEVCCFDGKTYPNKTEAQKVGQAIRNCGPCGACSNEQDIAIMAKTRDNLTKVVRKCAWKDVFSRKLAKECIQKEVGFTPSCLECWMDNVECDRKHCLVVCMESAIIDEPFVDEHGNLNKCLQCDEDKCGPAFKSCAGANRRRSCIHSDIFRDETKICHICNHTWSKQ